jgi:hypothetical protein
MDRILAYMIITVGCLTSYSALALAKVEPAYLELPKMGFVFGFVLLISEKEDAHVKKAENEKLMKLFLSSLQCPNPAAEGSSKECKETKQTRKSKRRTNKKAVGKR